MTAEIGQFALILALVLAAVQTVVPLVGAWRADRALMAVGRAASMLQLLFVVIAFASLAACYILNDFSVALVAEPSNMGQPRRFDAAVGVDRGALWGRGQPVRWFVARIPAGQGAGRPGIDRRGVSRHSSVHLQFLLTVAAGPVGWGGAQSGAPGPGPR